MFFLQARQVPVTIVAGMKYLEVPKMSMDDFKDWAEEIRLGMVEQAYSHLPEDRRAETMALYPVTPPTRHDIRLLAASDAGMERVARTCLPKAEVFEAVKETYKVKIPKTDKEKEREVERVRFKKGKPLPPLTESEVDEIIKANTGRMAHLATVLADMNDQSMALPAAVLAEDEDFKQTVESEKSDPLL